MTQYDERCRRATFYTTGMEHSPTSATGTGWEPTPWHATQRAAWEVRVLSGCRKGRPMQSKPRLKVVALAVHPDGDVADAGPGVQPGAQRVERAVMGGHEHPANRALQ